LEGEAYLGQIKWLLVEEKKNYGHTPSLITNRGTKISTVFSAKNHNSLISKYKKPQLTVTYKFKYPPKTYIPIFTKTAEKSGRG
jgi:hypothetical protein